MTVSFLTPAKAILAGTALVLATGCAGGYGANETTASGVGYASTVREGTIVGVREVTISPDQNYLGAATGAVLGGLAGSQLGGGDVARTAGGVGGAVAGGVAGNEMSKAFNKRRGYAYMVKFDTGEIKEITQGIDIFMQVGTPVFVTFGANKTTVAPRQGY